MTRLVVGVSILLVSALVSASPASPSIDIGAAVYVQRCAICHGERGMGEGNLAIRLKDYPNTNLLTNAKTTSHEAIRDAIAIGGSTGAMSNYMPPMGADLTWTETESAAMFVALLREDNDAALKLLRIEEMNDGADIRLGQEIYGNRCQLCHGTYGEGDGRMSKIIKNPPPANLVASRLPDPQVFQIIVGGGTVAGRSPQMPPWGDQLSQSEIESVMMFLKSIRH